MNSFEKLRRESFKEDLDSFIADANKLYEAVFYSDIGEIDPEGLVSDALSSIDYATELLKYAKISLEKED